MPGDKKFDLGDYVEVKDRIARFYELYGQGRLVTGEVRLTNEPDGVPRVMVQGLAYRTPDDPLPGVGWSWMVLPGTTSYTKGSELENVETSAWGRAIGSLGILILSGLASRQEVQNKQGETDRPELDRPVQGLIGTVEVGKPPVDMELRTDREQGAVYGFKLKNGAKAFQCLAVGQLADALSLAGLTVGTRVTVEGSMVMVPWEKDGKPMPPFSRVMLSRVHTPDWTLPAVSVADVSPGDVSDDEAAEILRLEMAEAS